MFLFVVNGILGVLKGGKRPINHCTTINKSTRAVKEYRTSNWLSTELLTGRWMFISFLKYNEYVISGDQLTESQHIYSIVDKYCKPNNVYRFIYIQQICIDYRLYRKPQNWELASRRELGTPDVSMFYTSIHDMEVSTLETIPMNSTLIISQTKISKHELRPSQMRLNSTTNPIANKPRGTHKTFATNGPPALSTL